MMNNVTRLPDGMHRQWRVYEKRLRAELAGAECSPDEVEHVCLVVKGLYLKYAKPTKIAGKDLDSALQSLNDWVYQQVGGLLMEVVAREVKLFRAQ